MIRLSPRSLIIATTFAVAIAAGCGRSNLFAPNNTSLRLDDYAWDSHGYMFNLDVPDNPHQLDKEIISLNVLTPSKHSVNNFQVTADLSMPSMPMPKSMVVLKRTGSGIYGGNFRCTMAGDWQLTVTTSKSGKVIDKHSISITVD